MSNDDAEQRNSMPSFGRQRRLFLERTALAAAGASVATGLAAQGTQETTGATKDAPLSCPDVKIPMKDVAGKTAFVTGGSSGIGLGIAQALTDAGMKVVIGYRTEKHLDEALEQLKGAKDRVHAINVDVTDRPGMERAAEETVKVFGKIHILVNNAGVYAPGLLEKATYSDWDWQLSVNLTGVFNGVHAFLPHIKANGQGGHIVSVASIWGLVPQNSAAIYSASKAAVITLMEALRGELADSNIGVSVYSPVGVRSNMADASRNRPSNLADTGSDVKPSQPRPQSKETKQAEAKPWAGAIDPLEAGRFVLRGIQNNDLYILTHPEYQQAIHDRDEALIASIPSNMILSAERWSYAKQLRNPTLVAERDRMLCRRRASTKKK